MTRYLVSARKYRPQTFSELVSQQHVGETLRNAIRFDRLAHAYLFCGPRGVGKTSAARILAKTINCQTPLDDRPNGDPCGVCDSCRAFDAGRSLDVIEIDAASNRGIDDVRALRENVRVPPQVGQKKVYIIDEVHMMSKDAFNALLKTLEEPPPYVQFLFATTEPQKVLPTILSRCQRFDFRRISVADIVDRLRGICEDEGISADEASLRLIARRGDGAMRDALSAFDQAVLLSGTNLEYSSLVLAFGTVDLDVYFETADLIAQKNRADLLRLVDRLVTKGFDLNEFLQGLTDHFRNLMIAVATGSSDLIETDKETAARYVQQSSGFTEADLLRHLIVADEALEALKRSLKPRLRVELALLKMASLANSVDLNTLLSKLGDGDGVDAETRRPAGASSTPASPRPVAGELEPATSRRAPQPAAEAARPAAEVQPATEIQPTTQVKPAAAVKPTTQVKSATEFKSASEVQTTAEIQPASEVQDAAEAQPTTKVQPADSGAQKPEAKVVATIPTETPRSVATAPAPKMSEPTLTDVESTSARAKAAPAKPAEPRVISIFGEPALAGPRTKRSEKPPEESPKAAAVRTDDVVAFSVLETSWTSYIKAVMSDRIHVGALLQHASPIAVSGREVQIGVPDDFHSRLLGNESGYLATVLGTTLALDPPPTVSVVISESDVAEPIEPEIDNSERIQRLKNDNPIIAALIDEFGGEVVW